MKNKLTKIILSAVLASTSLLLINTSSQAEIYKWTDAKGVTHYSAQKPTQQKIKSEDIGDKIRSAAGKHQALSQKPAQASTQTTGKKSADGKTKTELAGPSARLVSFCKNQRKNLTLLTKNYRNRWEDKGGKVSFLDQKQRKEKVRSIRKSITKECAGV